MYSYIVCSVNAVYIRLNMFSPTVHIMQCNVQLHCLFCGFIYNLVQNARCMAVSVSVFVEWRTE